MKKRNGDNNLKIIFGVTLIAVMGVASIAPAFPKIVRELNISAHEVGYLITVFTVPGVFLTPVLGVLADRLGRKKILVPSLFLFGIAGGCCALVREFNLLLLFRFLQGVGAASLGSLNVTILGDLYSGSERTSAIGYNASVLSIGTASYPFIGGILATFGWYYPFYLPLLAVPLGLAVLFILKNPEPVSEQALSEYLKSAWRSVKNVQVLVLFVLSFTIFIILYGTYLSFFPILLGDSFGASPFVIGILMSSMSLTTALTSSQIGRVAGIFKDKNLLTFSFLLYFLSLVIIPFVGKLWLFLLPAFLFGVAQGINIPLIQSRLTGMAPIEYRAAFLSVNGLILRAGQTAGPMVMAAVFSVWNISGVFLSGAFFSIGLVALVASFLE